MQIPDYAHYLTGYRAWGLSPEGHLRSVSMSSEWKPKQITTAKCVDYGDGDEYDETCPKCGHHLHVAPVADCTCGLWCYKEASGLEAHSFSPILGQIALWGHIIEHEDGYRSEFAYPLTLWTTDDYAPLIADYGVPVKPMAECPYQYQPATYNSTPELRAINAATFAFWHSAFTSGPLFNSPLTFSHGGEVDFFYYDASEALISEPTTDEIAHITGHVALTKPTLATIAAHFRRSLKGR